MKSTLDKKEDVKKVATAKGASARPFIKIGAGKNFIRLMSKDFNSEFVHTLQTGDKAWKSIVCLGGGYAPNKCPICAKGKSHWDTRKGIMDDPDFKKSKKLKAEADVEKSYGKDLQTNQNIVMRAVYGAPMLVKERGEKKTVPEWEKEEKFLRLTTPQWFKLTEKIFEDYKFMKDMSDLVNRNLCFQKVAKSGKSSDYTEVEIIPSKEKSPSPKIEGEPLDLDSVFNYGDEKEAKKILAEHLAFSGDDDGESLEDLKDKEDDGSEKDSDEDSSDELDDDSEKDDKEKSDDGEDNVEDLEKEFEKTRKKGKPKSEKKSKKEKPSKDGKKKSKKGDDNF